MVTKLPFNKLLSPNGPIRCNEETFEETFVRSMGMNKRDKIYNEYKIYLQNLKIILNNVPFTHWVDGSFVTDKRNPNDIDVLTFLCEQDYLQLEQSLQPLIHPAVQKTYQGLVDAYIVPLKQDNFAYWLKQFETVTKDKICIPGQKKGFIELIF